MIKIYEKENPDQYTELKKLWMNYQGRKIEVVKYYESVMSAQVPNYLTNDALKTMQQLMV